MSGPTPGPTLAEGEEWMACRVCRRSLERLEDVEVDPKTKARRVVGVVWDHTGPDRDEGVNHRVEPVPYSEIGEGNVRLRCDFCLTYEGVCWELPVRDFEMALKAGSPLTDWGSTNAWSCCGVCADLINRGDWPRLTRHAAEASHARYGTPIEQSLAALKNLYRTVRKYQAGSVRLDPLRAHVDSAVENADSETRRWS